MSKFAYTAIDKEGKRISGQEDAYTPEEVLGRLQAKGLTVVKITAQKETTSEFLGISKPRAGRGHRRVKLEDLVIMSRQLATLLGAGVSLLKSLQVISQQVESTELLNVIERVTKDVEQGVPFHEAIAKYPKIFSDLWVNLIETGEASGNLPVVLERLAYYLEEKAAFRRKIISALVYPVILFVVALGAVAFFMFKIIPTFSTLFESLGAQLPALTLAMVSFSKFLQHTILFIIAGLGVGIYFLKEYLNTQEGRKRFDAFKLRLPLFGNFFQIMAVERFSSEVSTLVESGVPILYALEITERSIGNKAMEQVVHEVKESVRAGKPLAEPLEKSGFFAPMVVQMVRVGEEIGELAPMFKRISTFYREQIETFVTRFTAMFEPMMIVFMGGVIGILVISMYLPIFNIANISTTGGR